MVLDGKANKREVYPFFVFIVLHFVHCNLIQTPGFVFVFMWHCCSEHTEPHVCSIRLWMR